MPFKETESVLEAIQVAGALKDLHLAVLSNRQLKKMIDVYTLQSIKAQMELNKAMDVEAMICVEAAVSELKARGYTSLTAAVRDADTVRLTPEQASDKYDEIAESLDAYNEKPRFDANYRSSN